ncbi:hypothetical protein G7Y89_g13056 [Cudoniella acicularis]|uniref:Uncharacterized protein n=1 Tax=Cudoniella acicularis TaxID=354080 RepID=A0A8H4R832_9HELO|nr:hypothetical protein G7Y89_g13056 [Cudoniella acicularis]
MNASGLVRMLPKCVWQLGKSRKTQEPFRLNAFLSSTTTVEILAAIPALNAAAYVGTVHLGCQLTRGIHSAEYDNTIGSFVPSDHDEKGNIALVQALGWLDKVIDTPKTSDLNLFSAIERWTLA